MLPFSLCNKKRLAIPQANRPPFPTTLSIPTYDIGKLVGLRTEQHPLVLGFIFPGVFFSPCFSKAGISLIFLNIFICIIYISEIYVPFHVQRRLILSDSNECQMVDIFSSSPTFPPLHLKFHTNPGFLSGLKAGKSDGKTDMAKLFTNRVPTHKLWIYARELRSQA